MSQLVLSSDNKKLISCGDAIFIWDISAAPPPCSPPPSLPSIVPKSASPRHRAPSPLSFEHLKAHDFTPLQHSRIQLKKRFEQEVEEEEEEKEEEEEEKEEKEGAMSDEESNSSVSNLSLLPAALKHYR